MTGLLSLSGYVILLSSHVYAARLALSFVPSLLSLCSFCSATSAARHTFGSVFAILLHCLWVLRGSLQEHHGLQ